MSPSRKSAHIQTHKTNTKKNKKDVEETAMTMIDWDDEDEDSMPPPMMAKRTYINDGGEESSLKSDEKSVPDSR
jgi:hypothetical protein